MNPNARGDTIGRIIGMLVFLIGVVFWRAIEGGQFEDFEGAAHQILLDDDSPGESRRPLPETYRGKV